jgi:hypothetical protein
MPSEAILGHFFDYQKIFAVCGMAFRAIAWMDALA